MKEFDTMEHASALYDSLLGPLYLIMRGEELAGLRFLPPPMTSPVMPTVLPPDTLLRELDAYFGGSGKGISWPITLITGTEFERKVWLSLREIPHGSTRTYKWVARRVGRPLAMRAVGQALGKNPLPIVLPCHRVIASDGTLGGFAPGPEIKRKLLNLEGAAPLATRII